MTGLHELDEPERFTAGAIGPPGQRTFFLQGIQGGQVVTLKVEKQQVAALCEYLAGILADLPPAADEPVGDLELVEPVEPLWAVGTLAVAYRQATDRILLEAEELQVLDEDEEAALLPDPATVRFHLSRAQVLAFIDHGSALVAAGRPTCRLCQRPMDPAGHVCPRLN